MTLDDISDLLALCAQYDGRTINDDTAAAWLLLLEDIPPEDGASAVREFYRNHPDGWFRPGHIVEHAQKLAAARALEAMRQSPPKCWGCSVRYVLSDRPGSLFAFPDDTHELDCTAKQGLLLFNPAKPGWNVMPGVDPEGFDELAWDAGQARIASEMASYRAAMEADPEYGPRQIGGGQ